MKLSKKQREVLGQLAVRIANYNYRHYVVTVDALIRKGLVKHRPGKAPPYVLTAEGHEFVLDALEAYKPKEITPKWPANIPS